MDPRHIHTHAFGDPSDEERERPPMWRFWRALPPKGRIGILFGSWYTEPIIERVFKRSEREASSMRRSSEINRFERMLADEGALVLKFWFHLSKKRQKKRLKELESDPETRWRVTGATGTSSSSTTGSTASARARCARRARARRRGS